MAQGCSDFAGSQVPWVPEPQKKIKEERKMKMENPFFEALVPRVVWKVPNQRMVMLLDIFQH